MDRFWGGEEGGKGGGGSSDEGGVFVSGESIRQRWLFSGEGEVFGEGAHVSEEGKVSGGSLYFLGGKGGLSEQVDNLRREGVGLSEAAEIVGGGRGG